MITSIMKNILDLTLPPTVSLTHKWLWIKASAKNENVGTLPFENTDESSHMLFTKVTEMVRIHLCGKQR